DFFGGEAVTLLLADEHHLVAGTRLRHAGQIDHAHVHADAADDGCAPATHEHLAPVLGRTAEPVGIADGQHADARPARRYPGGGAAAPPAPMPRGGAESAPTASRRTSGRPRRRWRSG